MPDLTWKQAFNRLQAALDTDEAVARVCGLASSETVRDIRQTRTADARTQRRILEAARALRREADLGLGAAIAARQVLTNILQQESLAQAQAEAERCLELLDKRFIGPLTTLSEINGRA